LRFEKSLDFRETTADLAFAGPDMKTLYIVGGGTDFKVQMLAQGIKSRGGK
jgi:hypothetical protein